MPTPTDHDEEVEEQEELTGQMSFFDHLEELRRRLLNSLIAVGVSFGLCYYFVDPLYNVFSKLIIENGGVLNAPSITTPFTILLKIAFLASLFLASPFILAQVWLFISPGLYKKERRYALPFIFFASLLFVTGGLFGYFIALPAGVKFLIEMAKSHGMGIRDAVGNVTPLLDVGLTFDIIFYLILGLGIVFEIPALIFLLSRLGIVSGPFLLRNLKYAVLICFVVAALITPTGDVVNMMIIGLPMIGLYAVGILIAFIFGKKRKTEE
jgi:sec-independent protein translocase protein TatC